MFIILVVGGLLGKGGGGYLTGLPLCGGPVPVPTVPLLLHTIHQDILECGHLVGQSGHFVGQMLCRWCGLLLGAGAGAGPLHGWTINIRE